MSAPPRPSVFRLKKHITPHLGGVPVGKLSTQMIREWRAALLDQGVSVSTAALTNQVISLDGGIYPRQAPDGVHHGARTSWPGSR